MLLNFAHKFKKSRFTAGNILEVVWAMKNVMCTHKQKLIVPYN